MVAHSPHHAPAYAERYAHTLAVYREVFGVDAPSAVWPPVEPDDDDDDDDDRSTRVYVKGLDGAAALSLETSLWSTVSEFKRALERDGRVSLASDAMRLIFGGRQLDDATTLAAAGVARESTIHVVGRLRGC